MNPRAYQVVWGGVIGYEYHLNTGVNLVQFWDHHFNTWHLNTGKVKVHFSDVCYSDFSCTTFREKSTRSTLNKQLLWNNSENWSFKFLSWNVIILIFVKKCYQNTSEHHVWSLVEKVVVKLGRIQQNLDKENIFLIYCRSTLGIDWYNLATALISKWLIFILSSCVQRAWRWNVNIF